MSRPLRSRTSTHGRNMAGARGLWRATGMTDADFGKPIIAIANSFTQFVPGHVHLKDLGQLVAREIEKVALGMNLPAIALKGLNDSYIVGANDIVTELAGEGRPQLAAAGAHNSSLSMARDNSDSSVHSLAGRSGTTCQFNSRSSCLEAKRARFATSRGRLAQYPGASFPSRRVTTLCSNLSLFIRIGWRPRARNSSV